MIELFQFAWSPYCLPQQRILEFSGAPFKLVNVLPQERSLVWKLTRQRYYGVPILRDGKNIVFETDDDSQIVAKYLDQKLKLDLFPVRLEEGVPKVFASGSNEAGYADISGVSCWRG